LSLEVSLWSWYFLQVLQYFLISSFPSILILFRSVM